MFSSVSVRAATVDHFVENKDDAKFIRRIYKNYANRTNSVKINRPTLIFDSRFFPPPTVSACRRRGVRRKCGSEVCVRRKTLTYSRLLTWMNGELLCDHTHDSSSTNYRTSVNRLSLRKGRFYKEYTNDSMASPYSVRVCVREREMRKTFIQSVHIL